VDAARRQWFLPANLVSTLFLRQFPYAQSRPFIRLKRPVDLKHVVNALAELAALGVAFVSLRDSLDLSTPRGLMFQIIGAMAEFERALILERVRAGLRMREPKEGD
jgi:hypothetical protein